MLVVFARHLACKTREVGNCTSARKSPLLLYPVRQSKMVQGHNGFYSFRTKRNQHLPIMFYCSIVIIPSPRLNTTPLDRESMRSMIKFFCEGEICFKMSIVVSCTARYIICRIYGFIFYPVPMYGRVIKSFAGTACQLRGVLLLPVGPVVILIPLHLVCTQSSPPQKIIGECILRLRRASVHLSHYTVYALLLAIPRLIYCSYRQYMSE